jgi:hypothetical protein
MLGTSHKSSYVSSQLPYITGDAWKLFLIGISMKHQYVTGITDTSVPDCCRLPESLNQAEELACSEE